MENREFTITKEDIIIDDTQLIGNRFSNCHHELKDGILTVDFPFILENGKEIGYKIGIDRDEIIKYPFCFVTFEVDEIGNINALNEWWAFGESFYASEDQKHIIEDAFYDRFGSKKELAKQLTDCFMPKEPVLEQQKAEELLKKFKQVEGKVNNLCDDLKSKQNGIKGILFDCMQNLYKEKEKIFSALHYDCSYWFDVELDEKLNIYYDGNGVTFRQLNGANLDFEKGLQIFKDNNFTKETIEKAFWSDMTTLIEQNLASIEKQHDKLIEKQKETENSTNEFMQTFTKKDTKSNDKGVDR